MKKKVCIMVPVLEKKLNKAEPVCICIKTSRRLYSKLLIVISLGSEKERLALSGPYILCYVLP